MKTNSATLLMHALIALLFISVSGALYLHISDIKEQAIKADAVNSAKLYVDMFTELRSIYTTEVVSVAQSNGLVAAHNYTELNNAIPLPATLTIMLGERLRNRAGESSLSLYSLYPFPWRSKTDGLNDDFRKQAWQNLQMNSSEPYFEFTLTDSKSFLRYAIADIMKPACVECHNTHPASPKIDWRKGDVRGVLEVKIPLQAVVNKVSDEIRFFLIVVFTLILLTYIAVTVVVYRLGSNSNILSKQVSERTADLNAQIETRKKAEAELKRQNKNLEKTRQSLIDAIEKTKVADIAKNNFLSNVSHELRTPLNGISGVCQLLASKDLTTEQMKWLDIINQSVRQEVKIIDDILNVVQLDETTLVVNEESFSLLELIQDIITENQVESDSKGLIVYPLSFPDDFPLTLVGDSKKIASIVEVLFDNAIKFTESGEIRVSVEIISESEISVTVKIAVLDTGIGIDAADHKNIFTAFSQADETSTRPQGGMGMGLAISEKLAGLLQGEMGVESELGKGSVFWLKVPLKK